MAMSLGIVDSKGRMMQRQLENINNKNSFHIQFLHA